MLSEKMMKLGKKRSVIRELFEYGNRRKAEIGAENVFDFSLGNPSVNPPACVKETIKRLLETEDDIALHGYTSAQGDAKVRAAVADYINRSFGRHLTGGHIYMTVGAAASLTISLKAMAVEGDEFITFSPFSRSTACSWRTPAERSRWFPATQRTFRSTGSSLSRPSRPAPRRLF